MKQLFILLLLLFSFGCFSTPTSGTFNSNYIIEDNLTIDSTINLLNSNAVTFGGIDGQFYFKDNLIKRELQILEISNGVAKSIN